MQYVFSFATLDKNLAFKTYFEKVLSFLPVIGFGNRVPFGWYRSLLFKFEGLLPQTGKNEKNLWNLRRDIFILRLCGNFKVEKLICKLEVYKLWLANIWFMPNRLFFESQKIRLLNFNDSEPQSLYKASNGAWCIQESFPVGDIFRNNNKDSGITLNIKLHYHSSFVS